MARLYEGLKPRIKDIMAIQKFLSLWKELISLISRLDDNFRRRDAENKG
jgi:hypothetical protein